jgi:hypothetical protein
VRNFDPQNLSDEILELLDLYVIGALDEDETAQVKNILSVSMSAQTYVDEGRNALTLLEADSPSDPVLFDSIKDKLSTSNEDAKVLPLVRKRKTLNILAIAASLLLVAISVTLIATTANEKPTLTADGKKNMQEQLLAFEKEKSTESMKLQGAGNKTVALMMNKNGEVMIDGRSLNKLSKYETYQLWAIIEDDRAADGVKIISASVLGSSPDISMTHVDGKIKGFAITKEVSGGVTSSSNDPMYAHMIA